METRIRVLPDQLINQIAAGEVVERPAAVVRELVDNALDAGAGQVTVRISGGGRSLIGVTDNGQGMSKDDLLLAIQRHATSKIGCLEDLESVTSLGFRGEALPSICSVARVSLSSRTAEQEVGTVLLVEGGKIVDLKPIPRPVGTDIEVRQLFFNTPARRKFLKSERSEELRIHVWLEGMAIAFPHVHFRLIAEDKELLNCPPREERKVRAQSIFAKAVLEVQAVRADPNGELYRLEGLLSAPGDSVKDRNSFVVVVNGRQVSDKLIIKAVRDGYDSMLKGYDYPVGFLALEVPASEVDVNVHPQKAEVRFRNSGLIYQLVHQGVREAIQGTRRFGWSSSPVEAPNVSSSASLDGCAVLPASQQRGGFQFAESSPTYPVGSGERQYLATSPAVTVSQQANQPELRFQDLRFLAQALGCYLLCEHSEALFVVDMHAAHERVNYNRIRKQWKDRQIASQALLIPLTITVGREGVSRLGEFLDELTSLGFEIEPFGETSMLVRAAPEVLRVNEVEQVLKALAGSELEAGLRSYEERVDAICARLACHSSVRSGDRISAAEVEALFRALDDTANALACPHGRPLLARFSRYAVEQWFKR